MPYPLTNANHGSVQCNTRGDVVTVLAEAVVLSGQQKGPEPPMVLRLQDSLLRVIAADLTC